MNKAKYCEKTCLELLICSIIELSDRYEQALIKPPKLKIARIGTLIIFANIE